MDARADDEPCEAVPSALRKQRSCMAGQVQELHGARRRSFADGLEIHRGPIERKSADTVGRCRMADESVQGVRLGVDDEKERTAKEGDGGMKKVACP